MTLKVNRRTAPVLRYALECRRANTPITVKGAELRGIHYSIYFVTVAQMVMEDWVDPAPGERDLSYQLTGHGVDMATDALRRWDNRPSLLKRLWKGLAS